MDARRKAPRKKAERAIWRVAPGVVAVADASPTCGVCGEAERAVMFGTTLCAAHSAMAMQVIGAANERLAKMGVTPERAERWMDAVDGLRKVWRAIS
jgi:hypothetical protein